MADLLGTDEFLVNRNDITYTQQQDTLMASLETTDYLLINRAGQTYKITGGELIDSVIDPLELTVVLNPTEGYKGVEVTAIPVVSGGKQPDGGYIFTYQWVTATDAAGTNKTAIAGETDATFTPDDAQLGLYLGCVVSTTDALGTSAEGEAYIGPIQVRREAPVIADVEVSEIYDGANRFTDKEFPYVTTMAINGEPAPTYELKAKVSGTTFDFNVKSEKITDVEEFNPPRPRIYSDEQYPITVNGGSWANVFSEYDETSSFIQWQDQAGTTGSPNAEVNANGVVAAYFNPPLNGSFEMLANFDVGGSGYSFIIDADSNTNNPTPIIQAGLIQPYSFGTVTNLRYVGIVNGTTRSNSIWGFNLDGERLVDGVQEPSTVTLTLAGDTGLANMTGDTFMTDGEPAGGPYSQTPYKLVTSQITDVEEAINQPLSYTGSVYYPITNAFNGLGNEGEIRTVDDMAALANENVVMTVNLPYTQKVEFVGATTYGLAGLSALRGYGVNGSGELFTGFTPQQDNNDDVTMATLEKVEVLTGSGTLNTIELYGTTLGTFALSQVWIDGVMVVNRPTTLTFADPCPDLKFFRVGDVVQGGAGFWAAALGEGLPNGPGSGTATYDVEANAVWTENLNQFIAPNGNVYMKGVSGQTVNLPISGYHEWDSDDGLNWIYAGQTGTSFTPNDNYVMLSGNFPDPGITIDGDLVKVVASPDVANRKLTVDGGNWSGGAENTSDWSTQGTLTNTGAGTANYEGMFNADTREGELLTVGEMFASGSGWYVDGAQNVAASGTRSGLNWAFSSTVEIVAWSARDTGTEAQAGKVYINGTEVTTAIHSDTGTSSTITKNDVTSLLPNGTTEINSIKIERVVNSPANLSLFGIYLDGKLLTDTAFAGDDHVEYQTKGGKGTIISVDEAANTITLTGSADRDERWIANNSGEGSGTSTDFYVTPANAVPIQQDEAWCKLQIINNKAQVTGIQQDDPGFLPVPAKDYSIKFPSAFGTGNEPDVDLPKGTCVAAIVAAENSEGRSVKESNCFMPIDVNPAGAAGPITDSTPTTLTVASNVNLSNFSLGDSLVMVNEDNDISNYTMQTSQIIDIEQLTGALTTYIGWAGFGAMDWANDVSWSSLPVGTGVGQGGATPEKRAESKELNDGVNILEIGDYGLGDKGSNGWVIDMGEVVQATISPKLDNIDWLVSIVTTDTADQTFAQGKVFTEKVGNQIFGVGRYFWMTNNVAADGPNLKVEVHYPTTLTFADPCPDLKFFRVGDVAQTLDTFGGKVTYTTTPANVSPTLLSGDPFKEPTGGTDMSATIAWNGLVYGVSFEFERALDPATLWGMRGGSYGAGPAGGAFDYTLYAYTADGTEYKSPVLTTTDYWAIVPFTWEGGVAPPNIKRIFIDAPSGNGVSFAGFGTGPNDEDMVPVGSLDGSGLPNDAKVLSTDVANRKMTVDGGDWDPTGVNGDDRVTYGPVTGTGTFQSADLNANTITMSVSNDRWIDNTNRLGIDFYCRDNITVLNADNPKHVAIQQAIADAFAAFPSNVNDRRTAIASSLYRLYAGENISADEFQLLEEVVSNAVNAVEPFALDGYYPLYYTAAKANAASSEGTHHTHTINGITYYMPDGGTIYHGNYI